MLKTKTVEIAMPVLTIIHIFIMMRTRDLGRSLLFLQINTNNELLMM